jgi:hypothetical protein
MMGLDSVIGREHRLDEVARAIQTRAHQWRPAGTGAMLITCSDESEKECVDAFEQGVVSDLLPSLKFARKSAYRTATLGGRYEWGSIHFAGDHYDTQQTKKAFKVMIVKVQSHVAAAEIDGAVFYGRLTRYDRESVYCGALHALLDGHRRPAFLEQLRETFLSEGVDRVAALNDESRIPLAHRALFAAVVNARLQSRKVMLEIQDRGPASPTVFLVFPCVTLNRSGHDTEILCGVYEADRRTAHPEYSYQGLGDDPGAYELQRMGHYVQLADAGSETKRDARDHRDLIAAAAREHPAVALADNPRFAELVRRAKATGGDRLPSKQILAGLLLVLGEVAPVPVALFLFGSGLAGVYHAWRVHRVAAQGGDRDAAEQIVDDVRHSLETMSPEQADRTLEALLAFVERA